MGEESAAQVIGTVLDGRYRAISLIGQGGMGDVYLGEDIRLKRRCALKVLHADLAADRMQVERFLREAQMIASFEHRNIVEIFSYGEDPSGLVYFAMELLTGEDLDHRVKHRSERPFTVHEACLWAVQIARAVAAVHEAGIMHRDLKVSNIFLAHRRDGEDVCKLLDFGIARAEGNSDLTKTGTALGTPNYMSPEQVRNAGVDRRTDIYSFGVLLFKLVTGKLPFTGEPIQVATQHMTASPPVPSAVAPAAGISPELDAIILKALEKQPERRFQSMHDVEAALLAVMHAEAPELAARAPAMARRRRDHPTGPRPVPPADRETTGASPARTGVTEVMAGPRANRPSPATLALTAALLVGVLAVIVVLLSGGRPHPDAAVAVAAPQDAPSPPAVTEVPTPLKVEPLVEPPVVEPAIVPATTPDPPPKVVTKAVPRTTPKTEDAAPAPSADPFKQIERKAQKCRKTHGAVGGPKITIDYGIGTDGTVTRSVPSKRDELGECLADAVASTKFPAKLALGLTLEL